MMQNILEIAIFQGFLFESIIWLFAQYFTREQFRNTIDEIDLCSIFIIKWVGIVSLVTLSYNMYEFYISESEHYNFYNRIFGPYWFAFWRFPVFLFLVQLLWSSRLSQSKLFRFVIIIILALVLYLEDITIFLTSLHRDYLPGSWRDYYGNISIINILIKCLLFPLLLTLTYIAKRKKLIKI